MKHHMRPLVMLLTLCLVLAIVWTASGLGLQQLQPAQRIKLAPEAALRLRPRVTLLRPRTTVPPTQPPAPSTTSPGSWAAPGPKKDAEEMAPGSKAVRQPYESEVQLNIPESVRESVREHMWQNMPDLPRHSWLDKVKRPGEQDAEDESMDLDWSSFRWLTNGYVHAPGSEKVAPLYEWPKEGARISGRIAHGTHLYSFGDFPDIPGWYIIRQPVEYVAAGTQCFIRAGNVKVVPDPYADVLKDIKWWEGTVDRVPGGVPVYEGPGTTHPVLLRFEGGGVNAGAVWPPDPNWVIIYLNALMGQGYGDGRGFVEAKYFTQSTLPAK